MVRITEGIKAQMIEMRQSGSTYPEICTSLGVTKERCIAYLKDIPVDRNLKDALTNEWQQAETEAREILTQMGFCRIHNLNNICSCAPSWDYLADKENVSWLIDVTINGQKSIAAKREFMADGYEHAILLKTGTTWKLIKLFMTVECVVG